MIRTIVLVVVVAIAVLVVSAFALQKDKSGGSVVYALYACDAGHAISALYREGPTPPTPAQGEPPTPTGKVEVSIDGGATTTLMQTLSASGVRYANEDESFVFWNKGDEALIMRNNEMDLTYTNCREVKAGYEGWATGTTDTLTFQYPNPFPASYVSTVSWPPLIEEVAGPVTCEDSERNIAGTRYCVSETDEGAAGSIYKTYTYTREGLRAQVTLRFPQCPNYDEPEQSVCTKDQENLDVDMLMHRMLESVRLAK